MTTLAKSRLRRTPLLVAGLSAFVVALIGGIATDIGPWYAALNKPVWQPPGWIFGPAWTVIFALAALAGALAWSSAHDRAAQVRLIAVLVVNALCNIAWSVLFFELQRPDWALAEVVLLWGSIVGLMVISKPLSMRSLWLLSPYLAWVSFAAVLNATIVALNAPF